MTRREAARPARARKRFGQHFLEPQWSAKIVERIAPSAGDVFLEIGPGRGAITRPLAAAASHVVAIEIDRDLARDLTATALPRVTVVTEDFLEIPIDSLQRSVREAAGGESPVRVAGNLPYNVATPILFRLCALHEEGLPLGDATLMLQREVADRLTAAPRTGEYGVLSVLVPIVAAVDRVLELPPGAFRPPPKVRSTVVRLRFHPPEPRPADYQTFTAVVRDVFTRRRKTLANALLAYAGLDASAIPAVLAAAGVEGGRRPETLDITEFVRLADAIQAHRLLPAVGDRRPVL